MNRFVNQHMFSIVPQVKLPRSNMPRPCERKFTFNGGYLIPFYWDEVLPGDTMNLTHSILIRMLSPLSYPIMDNIYCDAFYFFVPERLNWIHWEEFNGENKNPVSNPNPPTYYYPMINAPANGFDVGSIADYLGAPVGIPDIQMRSAWHRAYNRIYNDWFKDENLIDSAKQYDDDTSRDDSDYPLQKSGKHHDYFTSCLPWPQKGVAVEIPLGSRAQVLADYTAPHLFKDSYPTNVGTTDIHGMTLSSINTSTGAVSQTIASPRPLGVNTNYSLTDLSGTSTASAHAFMPDNLYADLSTATAATINSLREAFAFQKLFERDARGGTRYTEIIRSHFGVVSQDSRLQRSEFLGSDSFRVDVNTVVQNSETTSSSALGELSAFAVGGSVKHGFIRSFSEHGVILGLLRVRCDLTYQRGINRAFSRKERFDFYYPSLANIGEQAVLNKEIYAQGTSADDNVFGYIGRWDEYRFKNSEICGLLRSDFGARNSSYQSLDAWHLSQKFTTLPTLSKTFIEENPPFDRISAITNLPQFIADCHFQLNHARVMPMYNIPGKGVL